MIHIIIQCCKTCLGDGLTSLHTELLLQCEFVFDCGTAASFFFSLIVMPQTQADKGMNALSGDTPL